MVWHMDVSAMEPMLVEALEDAAASLLADASGLAKRMHPILRESVGTLVRLMNCYYSNLIEGHDTHPRDIDGTLANDFSNEPRGKSPRPSRTGACWSRRAAARPSGWGCPSTP